jgi:NAD-dependent deacetylase
VGLSSEDNQAIERVAQRLAGAKSALFVTGAGLSADSGLPTYRGVGGLYDDHRPHEGMEIEEILSGPVFRSRPELTWKYLREVAEACRGARPNRGHEVIAGLEAHLPRVVVLTQNVDGLHRQAGSSRVIDIHGDLHHLICTRCAWDEWVDDLDHLSPLPRCIDCHSVVRPEVVLFGEWLPEAKVKRLREEMDRGFDVVFSVGTSSLFPYIQEPVRQAHARGGYTVEINPGSTEISSIVDEKISAGAAEALDALWAHLLRLKADATPRP